MKRTFIPLDLAYLGDDGTQTGTILEIHRMVPEPHKSDHELTGYGSSQPVRYVLELNADWFHVHGVSPGARVEGLPHPTKAK